MKPLALLIAALALAGCFALPVIPRCHWRRNEIGAQLYRDTDGVRVGSIISGGWPGDYSQGCFYLSSNSDCQEFETTEQAIEYVRKNVMPVGASQ